MLEDFMWFVVASQMLALRKTQSIFCCEFASFKELLSKNFLAFLHNQDKTGAMSFRTQVFIYKSALINM